MIYLFHGEDAYTGKLKLERQLQKFQEKYGADSIFVAKDHDIDTAYIASIISDSSLFSEKKMVVLENQFSRNAVEQKSILSFIEHKDVNTYILIYEPSKVKKDHAIFSIITDPSHIFESTKDATPQPGTFNHLLSELQITIDARTLAKITAITGNDFFAASQLIRTIAANIFPEKNINELHLKNSALTPRQEYGPSVFDIANAVVQKKPQDALRMYRLIQQDGEGEGILSGPVPYQIRSAIIAKAGMLEKIPNERIIKDFKMKPFGLTKAQQLAKNKTLDDLTALLDATTRADIQSKSTQRHTSALFEHMLLEL